ncbi:MAG: M20 metallopeptidase family protein [Chitinophagaceae bacterium]
MKKYFILILTLAILDANAQTINTSSKILSKIKIDTDKIYNKLLKIRRQLHANPELAGNEKQTQQTIKQYLLSLGIEVKTNIYGYGLVGILHGAKKGKAIAWRADMDALPNNFEDNVDFKSKVANVQHGCGHDVHMTIALGIAEVLSKNKNDLKGTIYFIFQPQEEPFTGAKGMIENKLLSYIKPTEIYGLHIIPASMGEIMVKENEMFCYQKGIRIKFKNSVNAEKIKQLYSSIKATLTRTKENSKPWEMQHILDPKLGLTSSSTIYKNYFIADENYTSYTKGDTTIVEADVYETEKENLKNILPNVKKVIENMGLQNDLLSLSFFKENPTINNNPKLTQQATSLLNQAFGNNTVTKSYGQVPFSNDDFAYFQQSIPGVYFFLGGSNFNKGMIAMIHAPNFMVDEDCIKVGVEKFAFLLYNRLQNK